MQQRFSHPKPRMSGPRVAYRLATMSRCQVAALRIGRKFNMGSDEGTVPSG